MSAKLAKKTELPTRDSLGIDTDDTVTFANLSGTNTGDETAARIAALDWTGQEVAMREKIKSVERKSTLPVNAENAALFIGSAGAGMEIIAVTPGTAWNGKDVVFVQGTGVSVPLSVAYASNTITVTLPTNGSSVPVATTYNTIADKIHTDLTGVWTAISTVSVVATAGNKGTTSGGVDGTTAAADAESIYYDADTERLVLPSAANTTAGKKWVSLSARRRIVGHEAVDINIASIETQVILDAFKLREEEVVDGAKLRITGYVSVMTTAATTQPSSAAVGFGPQWQEAQEGVRATLLDPLVSVFHFATDQIITTSGDAPSPAGRWMIYSERPVNGHVITSGTTTDLILLSTDDFNWADNMSTREAPIDMAQDFQLKLTFSGPAEISYLVSWDLSLDVVLP